MTMVRWPLALSNVDAQRTERYPRAADLRYPSVSLQDRRVAEDIEGSRDGMSILVQGNPLLLNFSLFPIFSSLTVLIPAAAVLCADRGRRCRGGRLNPLRPPSPVK